jgi:hypothetical protein
MFGLSFSKFLFLAAIVAIVWFAVKYGHRFQAIRRALREELLRRQAQKPPPIAAEDLVKCAVCGAYVGARSASSCGRSDCPWGRR